MANLHDEIYDDPSSQLLAELEGAAKASPPTIDEDEVRRSATPYDFTPDQERLNNDQTGSHHSSVHKDKSGHDYTNKKRASQEHIDRVNEHHNNSIYYDYTDREDEMFPKYQSGLRGGEARLEIKSEPQDVVQDGERFGDRDVFVEEDEDGDAEQELIQNDEHASQTEGDDVEMRNADEAVGTGRMAQIGYVSRMGDIRGVRRGMSHVSASPELGEDAIKAEEPNGVMSDSEGPASERDEMDDDEKMEDEDGDDEEVTIVKIDESDNSEAQSESDSEARNEDRELSHSTNGDDGNGDGSIRGTGKGSAVLSSALEPQPPVEDIKKQYKGDKNLHDKAKAHCTLRVDSLSGRGRYLVAVLDHRVELKDVRKERDLLWIKANEVCPSLPSSQIRSTSH